MTIALANYVKAAEHIVVFTGAGISTESGIPDFRSPTGLWQTHKPIQFQDFVNSEDLRIEAWKRKFEIDKTIEKARPNKGHLAIAELVRSGRVRTIITQNIDNLHQDSGVDEDCIIELHGNGTYASCLDCQIRYTLDDIKSAFTESNGMVAPTCRQCDGIVKSATISFGQSMPEGPMQLAEIAALSCDLMIAIGSSLQVYPAAGFPILSKRNGSSLIIINREPTELDAIADLIVNQEIGDTLEALIEDLHT
jgi:NAD-dependent deacetylase